MKYCASTLLLFLVILFIDVVKTYGDSQNIKNEATTEEELNEKFKTLLDTLPFPCGFDGPSIDEISAWHAEELALDHGNQSLTGSAFSIRPFLCHISKRFCHEPVTIPVYVHNVYASLGTGKLTRIGIRSMISRGNRQFLTAGFRFRLRKVNYVRNAKWFYSAAGSPEELEMQTALKVGGVDTLNVYLKIPTNGNSVYCGYSFLARSAQNLGVRDGVTVHPNCADDDKTFSHEVGHYLNLLHTFDGGCDPGDLVDDTPAQLTFVGRIDGCPSVYPDSCPDQRGRDPLDNMMDYSPNGCPDRFTNGQVERMHNAWHTYRVRDSNSTSNVNN